MSFQPRPYQQAAIDANIDFFKNPKKFNGIEILPTGSGKSVVIANTAFGLDGKTVVFQPSKEILRQNYTKFMSYGYRAGIYSASAGMKHLDQITFATIGSVANKHHLFKDVRNIIIDECHLVNAKSGMYYDFIKALDQAKVLGLTATPYRLASGVDGAELRFLTRTRPKIFNKVLYYVQNDVLFDNGYLAPLQYFSFNLVDRKMLQVNSAGSDFTEDSVRRMNSAVNMIGRTIEYANRILEKRNNILVFCGSIDDANKVAFGVPGAVVISGKTPPEIRDRILSQFTKGIIRCVVNVGVLTTGFDYPGLEAVLIGKSTMSLALYYQIVGRVMRPYTYDDGSIKTGWIVDLGGNTDFFGKIETMRIEKDHRGLYHITNNGRQLTNVPFQRAA